jgi:hypothetical protein
MRRLLRNILLSLVVVAALQPAFGAVFISVGFAPPPLPVYDLPECPGDGYIWVPGYWAWDEDDGYYWVPGYWMTPPEVGFLWTPAWWGWSDGAYLFHEGYWGPHVGFYGDIHYGFGYFGTGFAGGRWDGGHFFYNTAVFNLGGNFHNTYRDETIIHNTTIVNNHVSYNGGEGGITARPTAEEEAYGREQHRAPSAEQMQHVNTARGNPQMRATVNQGRPAVAATARPGSFSGRGVVAAKSAGGEYHAPPAREPNGGARPGEPTAARPGEPAAANPSTATHARDLQQHQPEQLPSTGNAKLDKQYQKQQQQMINQQNKEHQQLQKQQQKEDQQAQKQNFSDQQKQQVEQKHQQQTQQMEQRHTQQTQDFHSRAQAPPAQKPPAEKSEPQKAR